RTPPGVREVASGRLAIVSVAGTYALRPNRSCHKLLSALEKPRLSPLAIAREVGAGLSMFSLLLAAPASITLTASRGPDHGGRRTHARGAARRNRCDRRRSPPLDHASGECGLAHRCGQERQWRRGVAHAPRPRGPGS